MVKLNAMVHICIRACKIIKRGELVATVETIRPRRNVSDLAVNRKELPSVIFENECWTDFC